MKIKTLLLILTTIVAALPRQVLCQEFSLSVSPIRVEHLVKQGERGTDMITVANEGTAPTRIKVSIENWTLSRDGVLNFTPAGTDPFYCGKWIRINPIDFRVDPRQNKEVRYTISVPPDVEEGGYRAAVIFETVPDIKPGEKVRKVFLKSRIVTVLYEVVGKPVPQGHANYLRAEKKKEGLDFLLALQNTGKVHFRTKGSLTVKNDKGEEVFKADMPDVPILPQSEREIKFTNEKSLPSGKYSALALVDIGKKELVGAESTFTVE
jgi:P pilus assembly chaperone PapD